MIVEQYDAGGDQGTRFMKDGRTLAWVESSGERTGITWLASSLRPETVFGSAAKAIGVRVESISATTESGASGIALGQEDLPLLNLANVAVVRAESVGPVSIIWDRAIDDREQIEVSVVGNPALVVQDRLAGLVEATRLPGTGVDNLGGIVLRHIRQ